MQKDTQLTELERDTLIKALTEVVRNAHSRMSDATIELVMLSLTLGMLRLIGDYCKYPQDVDVKRLEKDLEATILKWIKAGAGDIESFLAVINKVKLYEK